MGERSSTNPGLGKALSVLPETELLQPISDLLHRAAPLIIGRRPPAFAIYSTARRRVRTTATAPAAYVGRDWCAARSTQAMSAGAYTGTLVSQQPPVAVLAALRRLPEEDRARIPVVVLDPVR
jgi:hypothetical protein